MFFVLCLIDLQNNQWHNKHEETNNAVEDMMSTGALTIKHSLLSVYEWMTCKDKDIMWFQMLLHCYHNRAIMSWSTSNKKSKVKWIIHLFLFAHSLPFLFTSLLPYLSLHLLESALPTEIIFLYYSHILWPLVWTNCRYFIVLYLPQWHKFCLPQAPWGPTYTAIYLYSGLHYDNHAITFITALG